MLEDLYGAAANRTWDVSRSQVLDRIHALHTAHADGLLQNASSVWSSLQDITDSLAQNCGFLEQYGETNFVKDAIIAAWEKYSLVLFASYIRQHTMSVYDTTGADLWILTDSVYNDATINNACADSIMQTVADVAQDIVLVTWFDGKDAQWRITTLWRWWSDTSACFLASALHAHTIILRKNVDGVMSSDPRIVEHAHTISHLSYEEAEESGKVVCTKAVAYLRRWMLRMDVANIFDPRRCTIVSHDTPPASKAKLLSYTKDCLLLKIHSSRMTSAWYLARISAMFAEYGINMLLIRNGRDVMYIVVAGWHPLQETLLSTLKKQNSVDVQSCMMINIIWDLDWDVARDINDELRAYEHEIGFGVFPHSHCVRLELLVPQHTFPHLIQKLHDTFVV